MWPRCRPRVTSWVPPMARLGRYFLPDQPLHVIQRGNNRQAIFFAAGDYARYRDWLADAADRYGCGSDPLVADHPLYRAVGRTPALRQQAYRALFRPALDADFV